MDTRAISLDPGSLLIVRLHLLLTMYVLLECYLRMQVAHSGWRMYSMTPVDFLRYTTSV